MFSSKMSGQIALAAHCHGGSFLEKRMPREKIDPAVIEAAYAARAFKPVAPVASARLTGTKGPSEIMYIERKAGKLTGTARIGRVTFSKTWKTVYYKGKAFQRIDGGGFKSNYYEKESGEEYWISGPRKDGSDRLYGEPLPIEIDENVREEYWSTIRNKPERKHEKTA